MNTPVNFELAKLLKETRWEIPTLYYYFEDGELIQNTFKDTTGMDYGSEFEIEFSELTKDWNDKFLTKKDGSRCFGCSKSQGYLETFSAPSISEVVMWLYEKYGIWISIDMVYEEDQTGFWYCIRESKIDDVAVQSEEYNSPTEAYEAGILYTLKNLIP